MAWPKFDNPQRAWNVRKSGDKRSAIVVMAMDRQEACQIGAQRLKCQPGEVVASRKTMMLA